MNLKKLLQHEILTPFLFIVLFALILYSLILLILLKLMPEFMLDSVLGKFLIRRYNEVSRSGPIEGFTQPKYVKSNYTKLKKNPVVNSPVKKKSKKISDVVYFSDFKEASSYGSKNSGYTITRNPNGSGFIAFKKD